MIKKILWGLFGGIISIFSARLISIYHIRGNNFYIYECISLILFLSLSFFVKRIRAKIIKKETIIGFIVFIIFFGSMIFLSGGIRSIYSYLIMALTSFAYLLFLNWYFKKYNEISNNE
jgi:Ca2+/Na+ antiporter